MRIVAEAEATAEKSLAASEQIVKEEATAHADRTKKLKCEKDARTSIDEVSKYLKSQDQHYDPEQTVARLKRVAAAAEEG